MTKTMGLTGEDGELLNLTCNLHGDVLQLNFSELLVSDAFGAGMPVSAANGLITVVAPLKGDVSADNLVNIMDIVRTLNIILGKTQPTIDERYTADVNLDGVVDMLDVVKIVNMLIKVND